MTIQDEINDKALKRLTLAEAQYMVDRYANESCSHSEDSVRRGDPVYYLNYCSACWRAVWPVILVIDEMHDKTVRRELARVVNGTVDAAVAELRKRWYVNPAGGRTPSLQDRLREKWLDTLRIKP